MLRRHAPAGSVFQEPVKQRSGYLSVFAKCLRFLTGSPRILCSSRPDKWLNEMTLVLPIDDSLYQNTPMV